MTCNKWVQSWKLVEDCIRSSRKYTDCIVTLDNFIFAGWRSYWGQSSPSVDGGTKWKHTAKVQSTVLFSEQLNKYLLSFINKFAILGLGLLVSVYLNTNNWITRIGQICFYSGPVELSFGIICAVANSWFESPTITKYWAQIKTF